MTTPFILQTPVATLVTMTMDMTTTTTTRTTTTMDITMTMITTIILDMTMMTTTALEMTMVTTTMEMKMMAMTVIHRTGVCKINGVVIVVNCCYSIGFSTTKNNKNTVYFANTGTHNYQLLRTPKKTNKNSKQQ